jgi:sorbose reductase
MSDLHPLNGGNFVHDNNRVVDGGSILKRFSLQGKTAIITGAAAGIGFSIAEAYAETGANIAFWYRTSNKAQERAEELAKKYNVTGSYTPKNEVLVRLLTNLESHSQGVSG